MFQQVLQLFLVKKNVWIEEIELETIQIIRASL